MNVRTETRREVVLTTHQPTRDRKFQLRSVAAEEGGIGQKPDEGGETKNAGGQQPRPPHQQNPPPPPTLTPSFSTLGNWGADEKNASHPAQRDDSSSVRAGGKGRKTSPKGTN